jgi:signal transduction histidine kinase
MAQAERERVAAVALLARASAVEERQRILADMHDGIGSQLLGVTLQVRAGSLSGDSLARELENCLEDLRLIVDALDPTDRSYEVALGELRGRLEPRCTAAGVELNWRIEDLDLPSAARPERVLQMARILQEAFTNALRHSKARRIEVGVRRANGGGDGIEIDVRDDGDGFDVEDPRGRGRGLESMRGRARRLDGELEIANARPGTRVTLRFPA